MNTDEIARIRRFLALARAGSRPGASGGEKRCHRLAIHLREMVEDCPGVELEAIQGAGHILEAACLDYSATAKLFLPNVERTNGEQDQHPPGEINDGQK